MLPVAYIMHLTSGRVRIKIPSRKGDANYFSSLLNSLSRIDGIESVNVNSTTASVVIKHRLGSDAILNLAQQNNIFLPTKEMPRRTTVHKIVTEGFKSLDNLIRDATSNAADLGGLAFLILAGLGIYQISRGNFAAPAWYTAFWYAMNIFLKSGSGIGEKTET